MSLHPDTASRNQSIWKGIDRDILEHRTQKLCNNKHVGARRPCASTLPSGRDTLYPMSLEVERSLADDFAYIAASQPRVGSVSAVAVEQQKTAASLIMTFAANEGVSDEVAETLNKIMETLRRHAGK
ncbi:hypothetical protein M409DRAFT_61726, partial [Zasmidium cellare ATCC 36951]